MTLEGFLSESWQENCKARWTLQTILRQGYYSKFPEDTAGKQEICVLQSPQWHNAVVEYFWAYHSHRRYKDVKSHEPFPLTFLWSPLAPCNGGCSNRGAATTDCIVRWTRIWPKLPKRYWCGCRALLSQQRRTHKQVAGISTNRTVPISNEWFLCLQREDWWISPETVSQVSYDGTKFQTSLCPLKQCAFAVKFTCAARCKSPDRLRYQPRCSADIRDGNFLQILPKLCNSV